jgi:hypothetical protein
LKYVGQLLAHERVVDFPLHFDARLDSFERDQVAARRHAAT